MFVRLKRVGHPGNRVIDGNNGMLLTAWRTGRRPEAYFAAYSPLAIAVELRFGRPGDPVTVSQRLHRFIYLVSTERSTCDWLAGKFAILGNELNCEAGCTYARGAYIDELVYRSSLRRDHEFG